MDSLELVVARYREDLRWLRKVPRWFRLAVYNKGPSRPFLPYRRDLTLTHLPNTGREDQAYLQHIVEHYDRLADVTVFAQGWPFDHVPDFHKALRRLAWNQMTVADFLWLGFIIDEDDAEGARLFQPWMRSAGGGRLPLDAFCRRLWNEAAPALVTFYPGAHFAVHAALIRRQPRDYYERALELSADLPHAAHCFERMWDRFFGVDGVPAAYRAAVKPVYLRKIRRWQEGEGTMILPERVGAVPFA